MKTLVRNPFQSQQADHILDGSPLDLSESHMPAMRPPSFDLAASSFADKRRKKEEEEELEMEEPEQLYQQELPPADEADDTPDQAAKPSFQKPHFPDRKKKKGLKAKLSAKLERKRAKKTEATQERTENEGGLKKEKGPKAKIRAKLERKRAKQEGRLSKPQKAISKPTQNSPKPSSKSQAQGHSGTQSTVSKTVSEDNTAFKDQTVMEQHRQFSAFKAQKGAAGKGKAASATEGFSEIQPSTPEQASSKPQKPQKALRPIKKKQARKEAKANKKHHKGKRKQAKKGELGTAPTVELKKNADPSQLEAQSEQQEVEITSQQAAVAAEMDSDFGENELHSTPINPTPSIPPEITTQTSPNHPEVPVHELPAEVDSRLSDQINAAYSPKTEKELQKGAAAEERYQADMESGIAQAQARIETAKEEARLKKEAQAEQARAEVAAHKAEWDKENTAVVDEYKQKADSKRSETESNIQTEVDSANKEAEGIYKQAEKDTEKEEKKADKEIEKAEKDNKKEKKKKKKGGFLKKALGKLYKKLAAKLKKAVSKIAKKLKKAVKKIQKAAKKAASKVIKAAQKAAKTMMKACGEALKAFASVALVAFPGLRDKFTNMIDQAVEKACKAIDTIAEGLDLVTGLAIDLLANLAQVAITTWEIAQYIMLDGLQILFMDLDEILKGLKNLVKSVKKMPDYFLGASSEEAIGTDVTEPLDGMERSPKEEERYQQLTSGDSSSITTTAEASEAVSNENTTLASKEVLDDEDFSLSEQTEAFSDIDWQSTPLEEGQVMELGGAADPVTTEDLRQANFAAENSPEAAPNSEIEPTTELEGETPDPDFAAMNDDEKLDYYLDQMGKDSGEMETGEKGGEMEAALSEEQSLEALQAKTGPLSVDKRLGFVIKQMIIGIKIWFQDNKAKIYSALIGALAGAGIITVLSGPGGLVAVIKALLAVMTAYFGAEAVMRIEKHMYKWGQEAWEGKIKSGAENLAIALAIFVMEFAIEYILRGLGQVIKRILAVVRRIAKAAKKGLKAVGRGVKRAASGLKKGLSNAGGVAASKGKYVAQGFKKGWSKGAKTIGELKEKVLKRFAFKRLWIERKGQWMELWGSFNAKTLVGRSKVPAKKSTGGKQKNAAKTRYKTNKPKQESLRGKPWKAHENRYQQDYSVTKIDQEKLSQIIERIRHNGDAEFLARARFLEKLKKVDDLGVSAEQLDNMTWPQQRKLVEDKCGIQYTAWKGSKLNGDLREAQHLIPAKLGIKYNIPDSFLNSSANGQMLKSGREGKEGLSPAYLKYKGDDTRYMNKVTHVGKSNRLAHPDYNKMVEDMLKKAQDPKTGKISEESCLAIAQKLRELHYNKGNGINYADDLHKIAPDELEFPSRRQGGRLDPAQNLDSNPTRNAKRPKSDTRRESPHRDQNERYNLRKRKRKGEE